MTEDQNNNNNNETQQKSTEIKLTQEQFEQLLQASNRSNNDDSNKNKSNIFARGYNKTKDSLDTNTRGMDGSVLSIGRWIISFVKEMIDGLREYMRMRQAERKQNREDD